MKKRVCAYCRVSTASEEQLSSFKNQSEYFNDYINSHEEWINAGIYADRGLSGTKLSRPEFDRLLRDCGLDENFNIVQPSKIDLILVKNTSRFARNTGISLILQRLKQNNCFVQFIDINKSTQNTSDFTFIEILSVMDANESRDKSNKVRFGHLALEKRNEIIAPHDILGFDYIKKPEKKLVPNKDSWIIQKIYDLYEAGNGYNKICRILTDEKIFTKKGTPFGKTQIHRILANEKYCGYNNPLKYDTGTIYSKLTYPKVKEVYKVEKTDKITPIITKEQFDKCQEIMKKKTKTYKDNVKRGVKYGVSKYGGRITCGICGRHYVSNVDRGRQFYNCTGKHSFGRSFCNSINITDDFIEKLLIEECNRILNLQTSYIDRYFLLCLDYISSDINNKLSTDLSFKIKEYEDENEILKNKIVKVLNFVTETDIDISVYKNEVKKYQEKINENLESIQKINNKEELKNKLKWISNCKVWLKEISLKRPWIEDIMFYAEKIIFTPEHSLIITYNNLCLYNQLDNDLFDSYPCCDLFRKINSLEDTVEFIKKHPDLTLSDIADINFVGISEYSENT